MKFIIGIVVFLIVSFACAPTRVLVKKCEDLGGEVKNCELIQKL